MKSLLAVDPGKHCMGWSWWEEGVLARCGLALCANKDLSLGFKAQVLISQLPEGAQQVLVELPRHYPKDRRIRVNDLIDLAAMAGACAAMGPLEFIWPASWKGQVPKDICHQRVLEALSESERTVVTRALHGVSKSLQHNVLDAVGIGQRRILHG